MGRKLGFHGAVVLKTDRYCVMESYFLLNSHLPNRSKMILHQASQHDANNQYNGNNYYRYQQLGNEGYSYGAPNAQDPSIQNYYGYPGYGNYEQQSTQEHLERRAAEQVITLSRFVLNA